MSLYSMQEIKDMYCIDLTLGNTRDEFSVYLNENYEQTYDEQLNFIGWSHDCIVTYQETLISKKGDGK